MYSRLWTTMNMGSACGKKSLAIPGGQVDGLTVNPDTGTTYVANQGDGTVTVLDGACSF
jgi:DNA-binding beta-propeller fold protein YncE